MFADLSLASRDQKLWAKDRVQKALQGAVKVYLFLGEKSKIMVKEVGEIVGYTQEPQTANTSCRTDYLCTRV